MDDDSCLSRWWFGLDFGEGGRDLGFGWCGLDFLVCFLDPLLLLLLVWVLFIHGGAVTDAGSGFLSRIFLLWLEIDLEIYNVFFLSGNCIRAIK